MTLEQLLSSLPPGKEDAPVICPFHVSDRGDGTIGPELYPSCWINTRKHCFICFGCQEKGSFIKLKALLEGKSYDDAKWDLYRGDIPPYLLEEDDDFEDPVYPNSMLAPLKPAGEIEERDIGELESELFGLRKDSEGNLYIPYRDDGGTLRGCQIRYRTSSEQTHWYDQYLWFRRRHFLFGENLLPKEKEFRLILCEGALDAVKLYGVLGIPTVAYNGSSLSKQQKERLLGYRLKEVILWYDNDEMGRAGAIRNYRMLKRAFEVYGVEYREGDAKDPCEMSEERIRELWSGRKWFPTI